MTERGETPFERWSRRALAALGAGALALVLVRAWNRPVLPFDCWSYHLPFASRLHGIGGGADSFVMATSFQVMFDAFPLAAEWLQGLLWKATGTLRAVASVNALALVALALYAAASFRLPLAALVFGFLSVPMVLVHAPSGYIDLFVATAVALEGVAALRLLELAEREREPLRPARRALDGAVFLGAAAAAGNAKYMGLGLALVIVAFLFAHAWSRRIRPRERRTLVALAAGAALLASGTVVRNTIRFSNPIHPFPLSLLAVERAPRDLRAERAREGLPPTVIVRWTDYPYNLGTLGRPLLFVLSATELDWWIRGVEPRYSIDSNAGDKPRRFAPARTGGWWGGYVVAQLALLGAEIRRRRRDGWSWREKLAVRLLAATGLVVAVAPLSYLLRYWLFWPLLLAVTTTLLVCSRPAPRARLVLSASLGACFLWSYFALPSDADLRPLPARRYDAAALRARLDPALLAAIDAGERFCLDDKHYPMQFRYSAAVVGGSHAIEQVREYGKCRVYPRLDVAAPALRRGRPTAAD